MYRKGNSLQQSLIKGQGIVIQPQQLHRLLGGFHLRQQDFGLADFYEGGLDLTAHESVQVADLSLQCAAVLGFGNLSGQFPEIVHQLGDPLDLFFVGHGGQLQVNFLLQTGMAVFCEASLKLLQVAVFQMPDPVEAVCQQVTAVGDRQQRALVGVDQIPQTI